ncbi:hypothetical protein ABPG72_019872 [Tetrahymena utriculariae]
MINRNSNNNQSLSPINSTKQNSQYQSFDFQSVSKLNVESINKNLNSSLSQRQEQFKANLFQCISNSSKIQSPQKKFYVNNQFYSHQSPKSQPEKFYNQKESQQIEFNFNLSKQPISFYQTSTSSKKQQQLKDKYLINKNKTQDESKIESDSDSEEEVSIWQENQLKTSGVDTDQFVDCRGEQLDFYQIYRLRSALYQPTYVSRLNTIQEVQTLCQHFSQEIPIQYLQQQQSYLDRYYEIQKKDKIKNQLQKKEHTNQNIKYFPQKCQTERIYRPMSSQQQNNITSTKLNQQVNQQLIFNEINRIQKQKNEILQNQSKRMHRESQNKHILKKIDKKVKDMDQSQQSLQQQHKSKRRQKISIDQQQIQKLMQNKAIPIKQINLLEADDENIKTDQSFDNVSLKSNNKLNLSKDKNNSIKCKSNDGILKATKLTSEKRKQDFTQTAKSVLSYLQKIVSNQGKYGVCFFQNCKFHNLDDKFMSQQSNKRDSDNIK